MRDFVFFRGCGGLFATTSTARSKRSHAFGSKSFTVILMVLAMNVQDTLNLYSDLMVQIKSRHNVLIDIADNHPHFPLWAKAEIIQLQVRLICETFALACLVAHGDVVGSRSARMQSAYQADFIIKALESLHPYFYPRPTKQIVKNGKVVGWDEVNDREYLTKDELLKSYREAADFLHLGDLRDIQTRKQKPFDVAAIQKWSNKVVGLLNHHNIFLADPPDEKPKLRPDGVPVPKRQILAMMQSTNNGKVQTALFTRADHLPWPDDTAP